MAVEVTFEATMNNHKVPVFRPAQERRSHGPHLREAAIAGIGATEFSKESGRSELQLAAECSKAACDDAGIDPRDIDGMITFTIDNSDEITLARCLGVKDLAYTTRIPGGGAAAAATIYQAMALVNAGLCKNVLIWRAMNERSQYRFGQNPTRTCRVTPAGHGTGSLLWCMPFGAMTPASWGCAAGAALHVQVRRHQSRPRARLGAAAQVRRDQPEGLVLRQADHARGSPELEVDHGADAAPARLLPGKRRRRGDPRDQPGARARPEAEAGEDRRRCQSIPYNVEVISNYYHDDLTVMPEAEGTAKRLWAQTGLKPTDMQAAMLYDAFTPHVLLQLEAFGFCKPGEARGLRQVRRHRDRRQAAGQHQRRPDRARPTSTA